MDTYLDWEEWWTCLMSSLHTAILSFGKLAERTMEMTQYTSKCVETENSMENML